MVAVIFYRAHEKPWMLGLFALTLAVYFGLHERYPASLITEAQNARLFMINLMSVAGLTLYLGLSHAAMLSRLKGGTAEHREAEQGRWQEKHEGRKDHLPLRKGIDAAARCCQHETADHKQDAHRPFHGSQACQMANADLIALNAAANEGGSGDRQTREARRFEIGSLPLQNERRVHDEEEGEKIDDRAHPHALPSGFHGGSPAMPAAAKEAMATGGVMAESMPQ